MHAVPRFQAKGFKRHFAEFRVNPDQFGCPSGFACDMAQLLGSNMGLFFEDSGFRVPEKRFELLNMRDSWQGCGRFSFLFPNGQSLGFFKYFH